MRAMLNHSNVRATVTSPPKKPRAPKKKPIAVHPRTADEVLALQRSVGNRATAIALAGPPVVQRHNSYEHQLLGDTKPGEISGAIKSGDDERKSEAMQHVLEEEFARVTYFRSDAHRDPRQEFPQVHWVQLNQSQVWVSAGELSAFGDYLPNPDVIDTMDAPHMIPVLQKMRQEIARSIYDHEFEPVGGNKSDEESYRLERDRKLTFAGAAKTFAIPGVPDDALTIKALDEATSDLGSNSQKPLTGRNACHFAPYSWERWSTHHNDARALALRAFEEGGSLKIRNRERDDFVRRAWVTNGYSNHFLQDSFAAGHLINKTLVMQWFLEYCLREKKSTDVPKDYMERMTTTSQPDIADRRAYSHTRLDTRASEDKKSGTVVTDPQSAMERENAAGQGAGLRGDDPSQSYIDYEVFLDSAFTNLSANDIHDFFNHAINVDGHGVIVRNNVSGAPLFMLGGDGTLLMESAEAINVTLEADSRADKAISDLIATGRTDVTVQSVFDMFPSHVEWAGAEYGLEAFNDAIVRQICESKIFPGMFKSFKYTLVRKFFPGLSKDGRMMTPTDE